MPKHQARQLGEGVAAVIAAKLSRSCAFVVTAWLYATCALAQEPSADSQPSTSQGRYVIVFSPLARADAFLLATETGRVWQLTVFTDVDGEPRVWKSMPRIDSDADLIEWLSTQTIESKSSRNSGN